jgi:hypothetical protein
VTVSPWYKQFWPWFLIAIPASSVVGGFATLFIALRDPDALVTDDYYRVGLAVNRDLERDTRAVQLGVSAHLALDPRNRTVRVTLHSLKPLGTEGLRLALVHPTRAGHDVHVTLTGDGSGAFVGPLQIPLKGDWRVIIEPGDRAWRLEGRLPWPGQTRLALQPDSKPSGDRAAHGPE